MFGLGDGDKDKDRSLDSRETVQVSDKEGDRSLDGQSRTGATGGTGLVSDEGRSTSREGSRTGETGTGPSTSTSTTGNRDSVERGPSVGEVGGGLGNRGENERSSVSALDRGGMIQPSSPIGMEDRNRAPAIGGATSAMLDMGAARRASEQSSMAALDRMRENDRASSRRADENASMKALPGFQAMEKTLSVIRGAEANKTGDPYNSLVSGGPKASAPLTDMTIREVMDYQKGMIAAGHISTALGAYQTKASTLAEQVGRMGLSLDTKFDAKTQDAIAMGLIGHRAAQATKDGKIDEKAFANALANEWAALAGPSGKSNYAGDGKNKASVDYGTVQALVAGLVSTGVMRGGMGPTAAPTNVASLPATAPTPTFASNRPTSTVATAAPPLDFSKVKGLTEEDFAQMSPKAQTALSNLVALNGPLTITSSFRSKDKNAAVSGAKHSLHMSGKAFDISLKNLNDEQRATLVANARAAGFTRIGAYSGNTGLHVDMGKTVNAKARDYSPDVHAMFDKSIKNMDNANVPGWFKEGLSRDISGMKAATAVASAAPVNEFADKYMGGVTKTDPAATAPTAVAAVEEDATPTQASAVVEKSAPAERSTGSKIAATGLDIGMGMIPGVGLATSVVNAGLTIAGKPTLGTRMVDLLNDREFDGTQVASLDEGGYDKKDTTRPKPTTKTKPDTFEEKYLGFVDTTKRPTPADKWDYGTGSYGAKEYG